MTALRLLGFEPFEDCAHSLGQRGHVDLMALHILMSFF
jgi:hypothetical protein